MQKVLLTTIHKPLGVESETCTENIQADQFNVQLTRAQGVFNMRSLITGWSLEFIAANLEIPTTVLHYPTKKKFIKELKEESIRVLGDIPLDFDIVDSYCQGTPIMDNNSKFNKKGAGYIAFTKIYENLKKWLEINE